MQEDNVSQNEHTPDVQGRRWQPTGRRTRNVIVAAVALGGLGLGGVAVAATVGSDEPTAPAAAIDAQARVEADARADRSAREPSAPATTASPLPTTSASTAAPSAKPRPRVTTAKPKPKPKPKLTSKPKPRWIIPMKGAEITSCYGQRWGTLHAGIDFAMPAGTPVRAAFGGTVTKAGDVGDGYGISVVVDHGNGYLTQYAHLSTASVGVGEKVTAGETLGQEGSTGDSTGPHLHFEVHQGQLWNQIDPAPFLRARGVDVGC